MDPLDGIAAFARVIDAGSFSSAAKRLKISKSAVSAHVQRLESRLGVRLLNRTTRKLSLTEAGTIYYRHCARILAEAEAAEQAAGLLQREPRGTLRISAPATFGWMHVSPAIPDFLKRYPNVAIDISLTDKHVNLVEEGLDLAIRVHIGTLPPSTLVVRKLAPSRLVIVATPRYLQEHGHPHDPAALKDHNCLCVNIGLWGSEWRFSNRNGATSVAVAGDFSSNSAEMLRAAALDDQGIAMLPSWAISEELRAGKLKRLLPAWDLQASTIYAVYPGGRLRSAKVKAFVDLLAHRFRREPWDKSGI